MVDLRLLWLTYGLYGWATASTVELRPLLNYGHFVDPYAQSVNQYQLHII